MRNTTIKWQRLLRYSLLFTVSSMIVAALGLLFFTEDWQLIFNVEVQITAIKLSFIAVIYIAFPVLLLRFCYYFYQLVTQGRKEGISLFCYQTLFNPINFLFRPSLLTKSGLTSRRRCLISVILLIALYGSIFAMSSLDA